MKLLFFLVFFCSALEAKDLVVFAASSLTDVMNKIAPEFEKDNGMKIKFNFDSSSRLAFQIKQGAQADVYFSADRDWNKNLIQNKLTSQDLTKELFSNDLVLITHKNKKIIVNNLTDLKTTKFEQLALSQENVPAGKYSIEALKKLGVYQHIKSRVVSGKNVRLVLAWVAKDEADLGMVYSTDAKASPEVKVLLKVPSDSHSLIIYPVSLMGKNPSPTARNFLNYLQTHKVKNIFTDYGFKSAGL